MNKIEFYNKLVDMYRSTGQGIATMFTDRIIDRSYINELVDDGLCKIVHQGFSYLPDEDWVCLTGVYCVENDTVNKDTSALTFLRIYKSIDPPVDLGGLGKVTLAEAIKNPDFMTPYAVWLEKNKVELEKGDKIVYLDETLFDNAELSDETIKYLKTRGWYTDNLIVSKCIERMKSGDKDNIRKMEILNELIMLQSTPSVREKYKESLEENIKEREDLKNDEKYRNRIRVWLNNKDGNKKIQDLV